MSEHATDFLPCPHCGSADIRVDCHRGEGRGIFHQGDDVWSMCCYRCGARAVNRYSREALRDAWNMRPDPVARPLAEYHEDHGPVVWWSFPICEPSYIGSPSDDDWPGYHTHWTPHPNPPKDPTP